MYAIIVGFDCFLVSSALHIADNSPQQVLLVNTPKCATGSIQAGFVRGLPCHDNSSDNRTTVYDPHFVLNSCPDGSFVFRSHELEAATKYTKQHGWFAHQKGKCAFVTVFRNPLSQMRSMFFEQHKARLCNGSDLKSGALREAFNAWIYGLPTEKILGVTSLRSQEVFRNPAESFSSAALARLYGLDNYTAVLQEVSGNGGLLHVEGSKAPAGEFGEFGSEVRMRRCELIILQLEKLEYQYTNVQRLLPYVQEFEREWSTLRYCPNAGSVLDAIETFELSPSEQKRMFETNPAMEPTWRFYGLDVSTE
jgi:hypothetical protein